MSGRQPASFPTLMIALASWFAADASAQASAPQAAPDPAAIGDLFTSSCAECHSNAQSGRTPSRPRSRAS